MNRFFATGGDIAPGDGGLPRRITLSGDNARHAAQILRLAPGDEVVVCDGACTDYQCVVERVTREPTVELAVTGVTKNTNEPDTRIFLFQSLPKADKMELIIQKTVELGVFGIFPFVSEHSVVRSLSSEKIQRMRKIAEAAAKQSQRGVIPVVSDVLTFGGALAAARGLEPCMTMAAHERAAVSLKTRIRNGKSGMTAAVFVGPEGGFSSAEADAFEHAGISLISLGRTILRTETAGIAVIANILYELEV